MTELCLRFGAQMVDRGGGAMLNIGSMTAYVGASSLIGYASSKRYVISYSEELCSALLRAARGSCRLPRAGPHRNGVLLGERRASRCVGGAAARDAHAGASGRSRVRAGLFGAGRRDLRREEPVARSTGTLDSIVRDRPRAAPAPRSGTGPSRAGEDLTSPPSRSRCVAHGMRWRDRTRRSNKPISRLPAPRTSCTRRSPMGTLVHGKRCPRHRAADGGRTAGPSRYPLGELRSRSEGPSAG